MKNKAKRFYLFVAILVSQFVFSQQDWNTFKSTNLNLELKYPSSLKIMDDEIFNLKYKLPKKPEICLADESSKISLIGGMRNETGTDKDLNNILESSKQLMLSKRSDLKILSSGIKTVNNKKIAFVKFHSEAIDQKIFNYIFFTTINGKILMCNFNCIEKIQKEWEPIADEIVNSIIIKS